MLDRIVVTLSITELIGSLFKYLSYCLSHHLCCLQPSCQTSHPLASSLQLLARSLEDLLVKRIIKNVESKSDLLSKSAKFI